MLSSQLVEKKKPFQFLVDFAIHCNRFFQNEFSSCQIELRNCVTQNDVTLQITNAKVFIEILN